tara:strand:- start:34 stop:1218 length:1185 start_codon:yes stop_codon:yes gene_type:complete
MALERCSFSPLLLEFFPMANSADSLIEHFSQVPDPRIERSQRHHLIDIVVIAVCGAICGADNWVHIAEFGRSKYDWLKTFLELPNGIPSHDTFGRVFARISPEHFQDCFSAWVQSLLPKFDEEIVPIDGKTLRHSYDRTSGKAAVHMVNAWAVKNRLVLGQFHCEGGLDEITIIPELLRVLALKGCIVTVDAIGCHKSVAEQVIDRQGDYVLAVKANQPKLLDHVRQIFDREERQLHRDLSVDTFETHDENHGRMETRRYWTTDQVDDFADWTAWKGLGLFGMVETQRQVGDQVSVERRYYIASLDNDAQRFGEAVRSHWSIENSLHWVLDVVFREDDSRVRTGHAPENLALLRQIAVSLLQQEKTAKVGVQTKRLKAGWDNTYLAKVLSAGHF